MASIRPYRRRRESAATRFATATPTVAQRSRAFSVHKDAQAFKVDVERRRQAGDLYQAAPERFGELVAGVARAVRDRRRRSCPAATEDDPASPEDCLRYLAPLDDLRSSGSAEPHVEDLLAAIATHAPRRAEMALSLLKRILQSRRGPRPAGRSARSTASASRQPDEREPRFLTWEEAEELGPGCRSTSAGSSRSRS